MLLRSLASAAILFSIFSLTGCVSGGDTEADTAGEEDDAVEGAASEALSQGWHTICNFHYVYRRPGTPAIGAAQPGQSWYIFEVISYAGSRWAHVVNMTGGTNGWVKASAFC